MGIFDIFTFKKEAKKVFSKENFQYVLLTAREEIIKQIKANIPGVEKKAIVDTIIVGKIEILKETYKNGLVIWLLDQLIKVVPTVTQLVYDFLKEKIENL